MLYCASINHHDTPLAVRERVAWDRETQGALLARLTDSDVHEACVIVTCNRTELYLESELPAEALQARLSDWHVDGAIWRTHATWWHARDAFAHLCAVASGVDSLVVGESQVLGQIKDAFAHAQTQGSIGRALYAIFTKAFSIAKLVREQTEIGRHPVSVASVAVMLAAQLFSDLRACHATVLGAGEMGRLVVQHLVSDGVAKLTLVNRTNERAEEITRALPASVETRVADFDRLPALLTESDIVISSVSTTELLTPASVSAARARATRPLFIIDIAVPRSIPSVIGTLPDVYLYSIDDLRAVVEQHQQQRTHAVEHARAVIATHVARFWQQRTTLPVHDTIAALHQKCEQIRTQEVERSLRKFPPPRTADNTPPATDALQIQRALDACTKAIVRRILHDPVLTVRRKENPTTDPAFDALETAPIQDFPPSHTPDALAWLRRLFKLDPI